ncbi:MAG: DUF432 domain-containing protein [Sulfolobales archaeon]|nr:DUF432 domain-containing protein [Sulfolobales archaeon]MCX8199599.1 DUF432 domain-containing protein [Sulfolobales archaeon]MDW8170552.1 DUF432 domain-containing protein [Desulfurococcaceae archaeon]
MAFKLSEVFLKELKVVNELYIDLHKIKVFFKRIDENIVELTKLVNGVSAESKLVNIPYDGVVVLKPVPPSYAPIEVKCLLIKLEKPVYMKPYGVTRVSIKLPIDVVIETSGTVIDTISLSRVKLSLYGPPDFGELTRYIDSTIVNEVPQELLGSMTLYIENKSSEPTTLSKVVIPLSGLAVSISDEGEFLFNDVTATLNRGLIEVAVHREATTAAKVKFLVMGKDYTYVMKFGY